MEIRQIRFISALSLSPQSLRTLYLPIHIDRNDRNNATSLYACRETKFSIPKLPITSLSNLGGRLLIKPGREPRTIGIISKIET